jgi:hypothetical protein
VLILGPDYAPVQHEDNHWDRVEQAFVLSMSFKEADLAYAVEHGWCVSAVDLYLDKLLMKENGWDSECRPIEAVPGAGPDEFGSIPIQPLKISWDRNGGTFSGWVSVEVITQIHGPGGAAVGSDQTSPAFLVDVESCRDVICP